MPKIQGGGRGGRVIGSQLFRARRVLGEFQWLPLHPSPSTSSQTSLTQRWARICLETQLANQGLRTSSAVFKINGTCLFKKFKK